MPTAASFGPLGGLGKPNPVQVGPKLPNSSSVTVRTPEAGGRNVSGAADAPGSAAAATAYVEAPTSVPSTTRLALLIAAERSNGAAASGSVLTSVTTPRITPSVQSPP